METVTALTSFDHYGDRWPGDKFQVSESLAKRLADKGLVVRHAVADPVPSPPNHPMKAAGASLSASPAAPASPQTTAILSAAGVALKRTKRVKFGK